MKLGTVIILKKLWAECYSFFKVTTISAAETLLQLNGYDLKDSQIIVQEFIQNAPESKKPEPRSDASSLLLQRKSQNVSGFS